MFNSRANLEVTVYEKRITDLLLDRSMAPSTGFSTERFNGGVMRTRGVEVSLNLIALQTAYGANARVLTAARDMLTQLLQI